MCECNNGQTINICQQNGHGEALLFYCNIYYIYETKVIIS